MMEALSILMFVTVMFTICATIIAMNMLGERHTPDWVMVVVFFVILTVGGSFFIHLLFVKGQQYDNAKVCQPSTTQKE